MGESEGMRAAFGGESQSAWSLAGRVFMRNKILGQDLAEQIPIKMDSAGSEKERLPRNPPISPANGVALSHCSCRWLDWMESPQTHFRSNLQMNNMVCRFFLPALAWGLFFGCQVPAYKLPGGFSSTYHRQVHGETEFLEKTPGFPAPAVDAPAIKAPPEPSGTFYKPDFQYAPPTKSEFQQAVAVPVNPPVRQRRYQR